MSPSRSFGSTRSARFWRIYLLGFGQRSRAFSSFFVSLRNRNNFGLNWGEKKKILSVVFISSIRLKRQISLSPENRKVQVGWILIDFSSIVNSSIIFLYPLFLFSLVQFHFEGLIEGHSSGQATNKTRGNAGNKIAGPAVGGAAAGPLAVVNSEALSRYSYTRKCSEG